MKYNYLKYSVLLIGIILVSIISSCTKGGEPVPVSSSVSVDTDEVSMMREGSPAGEDDENGGGTSIIGGDNNEDDDDSIIGGDDNEDDDVDIIGGDVIIGGGLTGGSSDGGKGGN